MRDTKDHELTESELKTIYEWLSDPAGQIVIVVAFSEPLNIGPISEALPVGLDYKVIQFTRHTITIDTRYWVDIAIREDTGEPIAFGSFKGNWREYLQERK